MWLRLVSMREISPHSSEPLHTGRKTRRVFSLVICRNYSLVNRKADCSIRRWALSCRRAAQQWSNQEESWLVNMACHVWAPLSLGNAAQRQRASQPTHSNWFREPGEPAPFTKGNTNLVEVLGGREVAFIQPTCFKLPASLWDTNCWHLTKTTMRPAGLHS